MPKGPVTINVDEKNGKVSAIYTIAKKPIALLTLAHGAGAGMEHSFMTALAEELAAVGISSLRFNFPFTEQGKRRPDSPAIAHGTIKAALAKARHDYPKLPLFAAGKSFGGRMSSQLMAIDPLENVKGMVFYGFPLHPAGKPSIDRAAHLQEVKVPILFLQGSRDTLAEWKLIAKVCKTLPTATLKKLEGADHSFKAGKQNLVPVLAAETSQWMKQVVG